MLIHNTRMKHAAMSSISVHSLELTRERHPRARRDTANATAATATAQVWQTATHQTNAGHLQHTKARIPQIHAHQGHCSPSIALCSTMPTDQRGGSLSMKETSQSGFAQLRPQSQTPCDSHGNPWQSEEAVHVNVAVASAAMQATAIAQAIPVAHPVRTKTMFAPPTRLPRQTVASTLGTNRSQPLYRFHCVVVHQPGPRGRRRSDGSHGIASTCTFSVIVRFAHLP